MLTKAGEPFSAGNAGILLLGRSGVGKSDLALRLIDRGATLVSDDRTVLSVEHGMLIARAPAPFEGLLEIRGVGIVKLPYAPAAAIRLALQLVTSDEVPRLPEPDFYALPAGLPPLDAPVPLRHLAPEECSTPAKIAVALEFAAPEESR